jgi:phosphohistidine phosphatase
MLLYLVRHAEALQADPRPLSPFGRRQAEDLARRAMELNARPARILHSAKVRARQTAQTLAAALEPREIGQIQGLNPDDDPESAAELARESDGDLMLVGHLPHVGELAALLLRAQAPISFPTATMACLERGPVWKLLWKTTGESQ